jgi:hypothetical protein
MTVPWHLSCRLLIRCSEDELTYSEVAELTRQDVILLSR